MNYKPVKLEDFKHLYKINRDGNVYSIMSNKILTCRIRNGYNTVYLHNGKLEKSKTISIHRLIALTFLKNKNNYKIINHIDGCKLNNKLDNLEWCTQKSNINDALKKGLIKNSCTPVIKFDTDDNSIKEYNSVQEAASSINLTRHAIIMACNGKNKTAGGYKWKYKINKIKLPCIQGIQYKDYPYKITKDSNVYSIKTKKFLKPMKNLSGYTYVSLCKDGVKKNMYVHRLVAETHIDNPCKKEFVNHINRNKSDNCIKNLEWVTHSENVKHYYSTKTSGPKPVNNIQVASGKT